MSADPGVQAEKKKRRVRQPLVHFHNGHSLTVWCGKQSRLANWATVIGWVTCPACRRMAAAGFK